MEFNIDFPNIIYALSHANKHRTTNMVRDYLKRNQHIIYYNPIKKRVARVVELKNGYGIQILWIVDYNLFSEITVFFQRGKTRIEQYFQNLGYEKIFPLK